MSGHLTSVILWGTIATICGTLLFSLTYLLGYNENQKDIDSLVRHTCRVYDVYPEQVVNVSYISTSVVKDSTRRREIFDLVSTHGAVIENTKVSCWTRPSQPYSILLDQDDLNTRRNIYIGVMSLGVVMGILSIAIFIACYIVNWCLHGRDDVKQLPRVYGSQGDICIAEIKNVECECCVCKEGKPTTILMPCKHVCLCSNCCSEILVKIGKCPLCRTFIVRAQRFPPSIVST